MQIITSTGFGDSGSSAITDFISEYKGIKSYGSEWECTFLHIPGGIGDLEAAVIEGHRLKTDFAIKQFLKVSQKLDSQKSYKEAFKGEFYNLSLKFIKDFTGIIWKGMYEDLYPDYLAQLSLKEKKFISFANTYYNLKKSKNFDMYESDSWRPSYIPYTEMYYSCNITTFYNAAKKYTKALFDIAADGAERLFLDQLIPPISIQKYINYIPYETKVFVVDKDPRDLFLVENLYNGSRFVPFENVNTFIKWYKETRYKSLENVNKKNTYHCLLNELINEYDSQCDKIEKYLGIDSSLHFAKREKFNPDKSKVNTGLYAKFQNYSEETKLIEKELKDFLYTGNVSIEKPVVYENPVSSVISECNKIQQKQIEANRFLIALYSTYTINNFSAIKNRKTIIKKVKAFIKGSLGILFFIPELLINLIIIIMES